MAEFKQYLAGAEEAARLSAIRRPAFDLQFNARSAATARAALLLLPGFRVFQASDLQVADRLLDVLALKAVKRGSFSLPTVHHTSEPAVAVAWKYVYGSEHVLVTVNFTNSHAVADIVCEDAPDVAEGAATIPVWELLTRTKYERSPEQMRTKGLTIILYEYEIQIFRY
jgi:hypothetical protein